jgi:hypothetical protein
MHRPSADGGAMKYPTRICASQYMVRLYWQTFQRGCQFWTSIDGSPCEIAIARQPNFFNLLVDKFGAQFPMLNVLKIEPKWVEREWGDREYFDDPCPYASRRGKVWRICDEPTPFPVYVVDPYNLTGIDGVKP